MSLGTKRKSHHCRRPAGYSLGLMVCYRLQVEGGESWDLNDISSFLSNRATPRAISRTFFAVIMRDRVGVMATLLGILHPDHMRENLGVVSIPQALLWINPPAVCRHVVPCFLIPGMIRMLSVCTLPTVPRQSTHRCTHDV